MAVKFNLSIGTLRRLAFRLLVVVAFAWLWPGPALGAATAALLIAFAVGCLIGAIAFGEDAFGRELNRWNEATLLFTIGCLVFYWAS